VDQLHPRFVSNVDPLTLYGSDKRVAHPDRPWLMLNMVTSADGAAASDGLSGGLSTPGDRRVFAAIRAVADVILVAAETVRRETTLNPDVVPMIILLTDGAGNVSISDQAPQDEAHRIATMIREHDIKTVTINMEHVAFDRGLASRLAEKLGGPCYTLGQLHAELLYQTVRQEMETPR